MLLVFIEKIANFVLRKWRKSVFKYKTGTKHNKFKLTGKVNILSSNINIDVGENVTLYDGVTLWGDAPIKIGNNTSIGHSTIIAAVGKSGGELLGTIP